MTPQSGGVLTPRGPVTPGLTPGRTPLRDKLNINSEEQVTAPAFAKHMVNKHGSGWDGNSQQFHYFGPGVENLNKIFFCLSVNAGNVTVAIFLTHTAKGKPAAAQAGSDVTSSSQERLWDCSSRERRERTGGDRSRNKFCWGLLRYRGTQTGTNCAAVCPASG